MTKRLRTVQYPDNGAYMVAAYVITAAVLVVYAVALFVRLRKAK